MPERHAVSKLLWNWADGSTAVAATVVEVAIVAVEVQAVSVGGGIFVKRRRPVGTVASTVARVRNGKEAARARSGKEDTFAVGTYNTVAINTSTTCPVPSTFF